MNIDNILRDFNTIATHKNWRELHTPKNLATAIAVEAAELLRLFQWLPETARQQTETLQENRSRVADELADVVVYALVLASQLNIDMESAIASKMQRNRIRFMSQSEN